MCDYSESGSGVVPTAEDFAALQSKLNDLEERLNSRPEEQSSTTLSLSDAHTSNLEPNSGEHVNVPSWTNRFPSVLFLDMDVYKYANTIPPKPEVDIPLVSDLVISMKYLKTQAGALFSACHQSSQPWLRYRGSQVGRCFCPSTAFSCT